MHLTSTVSHLELLHRVGIFKEALPRTLALERQIGIGAGFHGKWYDSQGEHWRGWMGHKDAVLRRAGRDPAIVPARVRWRLNCAPMMFWLAEAANVDRGLLDRAEEVAQAVATRVGHDHPSHGKALREVLPWSIVEAVLRALPPLSPAQNATAERAVAAAHQKLMSLRGKRYA